MKILENYNLKKFIVIDALALAYKAYFAFVARPLITKTGIPTSAVFGFVNQLIKILEEFKPDYIAVAFDSHEKTFRHEQYPEYKANRAVMPDDMIPQIERIKGIIEALNMPVLIKPRFEADDIIGLAVKCAEKLDIESFIISPDKDLMQLITEKTKLVRPGKANDAIDIYDIEKVKSVFGFEPIRIIDYLALLGDASDNIPGVSGIGEVAAKTLIPAFGTIENIYNEIDSVPVKFKNKLLQGKDSAFLSKSLATIDTNMELKIDFDDFVYESPDWRRIKGIFEELEFRNLYVRLRKIYNENENEIDTAPETENSVFDKSRASYKLITTIEEAKSLADRLTKSDLFVFDTETNSLDAFTLSIAGVSFCLKENEAYFVALNPFGHSNDLFSKDLSDRLPMDDFITIFKPLFENERIKKVCQNGKFDISVLGSVNIEVNNFFFDTMIASYVIDPDQKHNMDDLSRKYLNYSPIPLSDLIGVKKEPERIFDVDINKLSDYSSEDSDITFKLFKALDLELEKNNLKELAYNIEFPLVKVLFEMERSGVRVDKSVLNNLSAELEKHINDSVKEIYSFSGEPFNINSPQQLQKILFEKLNLPSAKKTKTGYSTDAQTLDMLRDAHPIIEHLINYRTISKLKSTYTDSLPNLINAKTGRIHTSFNQTVASTGRLSSNEPNLQNIPIRTEFGKEIRKAFIPRNNDYLIMSADYSQIELRIMAHYCMDERLIEAFANKEDIHTRTASLVFKIPPAEVTSDLRRKAKEVNFGILYGIGPFGLKNRLKISQNYAKEIIDGYFKTFPNVKSYMDNAITEARTKGFATTLTGRRRFLKNINSSNNSVKQFDERAAINMPIQGSAADMIKLAMIKIADYLKKNNFKTQMILQVHDELIFDTHKNELEEIKETVRNIMETCFPLKVPIFVDIGVGDNWLDAH